MDSPDLHFKYQKLAFEYSKLRAQNQVLKKAVIEEQEKSLQLRDVLKSKDQNLRKSEQEIDSLSLRNQQLTKRLSLLQDDLEIIKSKQQKGRTNLDPHLQIANDNNVYAEELEAKIRDNAKLHAELADVEFFYKSKVSDLEAHLEEVSKIVTETTEEKKDDLHLQNEIKKLENERILQEVYGQQREARILALEEQLKPLIQLENKLDVHAPSVASFFAPDKRPNNLSDILEGTSKLISRGKLLFNLSKPLEEICVGFSKFYICYASLLKSSSSQSASKLKVVHHLVHENECWHLLFKRYEEMCSGIEKGETVRLENLIGINEFNNAFNNCSVSLRKLLPVLSERWDCFQDSQMDSQWSKSLCRIVSCFAAVNPYISSLAAHRDGRVILTASAIRKILHFLHERICKLHFTSKELLAALELLKIEEEKKEEFKIILSSIENAFNKIMSIFWEDILMNKNVESGNSGSSSSAYSRSPGTPHLVFNQNIGNFESPDRMENIGDSIQFTSSATCLTQQLSQATNRLAKLEEEREHWRLECQLLSHRLNKESMIAEELQGLPKCQDKTKEDKIALDDIANISSTSIMSEIVGFCSNEEREKEIRNHFTNRCSQLYMQLTSCISQAALYQNECENLLKQLSILEDTKQATDREVEKQRSEKIQIQETLSTTSRNYEEQISTMSDHLADMNEKITLQADAIEHLEFELKKKTKK